MATSAQVHCAEVQALAEQDCELGSGGSRLRANIKRCTTKLPNRLLVARESFARD